MTLSSAQIPVDFHPVEANLRQSFRALAAGREKADIRELRGVSIASLGVAFQMFNAAFLNGPVATAGELEQRLELSRLCLGGGTSGWAFWLCEDWVAKPVRRKVTSICAGFNLKFASELPGMMALDFSPVQRRLPELEFRRAEGASALSDFRRVGEVSFRVPPEWFAEVFHDEAGSAYPSFTGWVGYLDGLPVVTGASVVSDGVIGLYNIATAPSHRMRGLGEAITRHTALAARAEAGPLPYVLQSTSMGRRMYERMGFREVTRIVVFNSQARAGSGFA